MSTTMPAAAHGHRDDVGSKMGMWLFLFTELILFGGLFMVYAAHRFLHPQEFHLAAQELDTLVGTVNTLILLTSSLTVAMSITAMQEGKKNLTMLLISITIVLAFAFMVNKYFEWSHKFSIGLYPQSKEMLDLPQGEILYFALYYVMTGLHALHVLIGIGVLTFAMWFIKTGVIHQHSYVRLESAGLYWHLVDIIWIFLFPLFYLLH
jgi:cytochrome c oxidase subunit III